MSMSTDYPTVDVPSYGGGSAGGGETVSAVYSVLHEIFPGVKSFGAKRGQMAARGAAAYAAKIARLQAGYQTLQNKRASAYEQYVMQASAFPSSVPRAGVPVTSNPDTKLAKLTKAAAAVNAAIQANSNARKEKKLLKKEQALQEKIARRELKTAANTEVRYAELYGPNAGYWAELGAPPPAWLMRPGG